MALFTQTLTPFSGAPGSLDMVAANAALKEAYIGQRMNNLVYQNHPFLTMVRKQEDAVGKDIPQPIISSPPAGRSGSFPAAFNNQTPLNSESFLLQKFTNYQVVSIDNQALKSASTDVGSFVKAAALAIDPAMKYLARNISSVMFRDGTGTIGQIDSIPSAGVIQLTHVSDNVQFEVNQILVAAATPGGTALGTVETYAAQNAPAVTGGLIGFVVGVDRSLGQITVAQSPGGAAATPTNGSTITWTAGSYLRTYGDNAPNSNANGQVTGMGFGLSGWLPLTLASNDSFFGVNRNTDKLRLAGVQVNGSDLSIEEALIDGAAAVEEQGGTPDTVFMNFNSWKTLAKNLNSKLFYKDETIAGISFRKLELSTGSGVLSIYADRDCLSDTAFMLSMDTWTLYSAGGAPHVADTNGDVFTATYNQASMQARLQAFSVLGCSAPGYNARIALSA